MKLLRVSNDAKKARINNIYDFKVVKTNIVPELNKLQVLYSLKEEESIEIPLKETILYLQEYEIDRTPNSNFMNLLDWACYNEMDKVYYLDTNIIEGCSGICQLEEEKDKPLNLKILASYVTNLSRYKW